MKISSPVFKDGAKIPKDYTRDGADKSPPLRLEEIPHQAKSLALIMDDPDAPSGMVLAAIQGATMSACRGTNP